MTFYQLPEPENFENNINGKNTHLFILQNRAGMQIALSDYGARLVSALVPDKHGNLVDVVLGFDSIEGYQSAQEQYHGATIGRYANRIADGKFKITDKEYTLAQNNGSNCLHGGVEGFHKKVWDRQVSFKKQVDFYYVSADGEEGFPGELKVTTSYELTNENEIKIKFRATADQTTAVNLTNHAYFNLNGEGNGDILNHLIQIHANEFIPLNDNQIPQGNCLSVENTPFDFRLEKKVVQFINSDDAQIQLARGYDHSFVNNQPLSQPIASAFSEDSGILLEVFTDLPAIHLYTGNYLADDLGKSGHKYLRHGGFCFEAQEFPDGPNQSTLDYANLQANETLEKTIIYKFSLKK